MSPADDPHQIPVAPPAPAERTGGSGEGSATALKALIHKRKMGEAPDHPAPPPSRPQP